MRVLIVSPYFFPAWHYGGPPRVAFEFAKALVHSGHEVTVYTTDTLNQNERIQKSYDEIEGIKIHYFRNRSNAFSSYFLYFNPLGFRQYLEKEMDRFDVVHLNEFRTHMTYDAARVAHRKGKPTFLHLRGALPIIMQRFLLKRLFDRLYGHWMLQNATRIIALTTKEKEIAVQKGIAPERIFVSPDCIEPELFHNLPSRLLKRHEWKISDHERVILHLGRIHKIKGLDFLLEALHLLRDKPYQLILAGPDFGFQKHLQHMMKTLCLPHPVRFLGAVEGEEKRKILAAADLMILPSRSEGLPGAILEAMACGLPVIVSKYCNLNEVKDYQAGLVIDLDPKEIAAALNKVLDADDRTRAAWGNQGKKLIDEKFRWQIQVKRFVELYQETNNPF